MVTTRLSAPSGRGYHGAGGVQGAGWGDMTAAGCVRLAAPPACLDPLSGEVPQTRGQFLGVERLLAVDVLVAGVEGGNLPLVDGLGLAELLGDVNGAGHFFAHDGGLDG
jgi:hypothetical protein